MDPLTPAADEPFLRAILHDPGDVLPRLVYADWLADHGREAEEHLIRADWPRCPSRRAPRERELLAGLERLRHPHLTRQVVYVSGGEPPGWEGGFLATAWNGAQTRAVAEWGFVVALGLTWRQFERNAAGWFARNPVRLVRVGYPYLNPEVEYGWTAPVLSPLTGVPVGWRRGGRVGDAWLPPALYDRLEDFQPGYRDPGIRLYPDRHAAWWACSLAAVALGRERADLPPLPRPLAMPPPSARWAGAAP